MADYGSIGFQMTVLRECLGSDVLALIAGVTPDEMGRWWKSGRDRPTTAQMDRIKAAYACWRQFPRAGRQEAARAWFTGEDVLLRTSPVLALAADRYEDVVDACSSHASDSFVGRETRSPLRIPILLELIRLEWEEAPEQRFLQLVQNLVGASATNGQAFYLEDEELIRLIRDKRAKE